MRVFTDVLCLESTHSCLAAVVHRSPVVELFAGYQHWSCVRATSGNVTLHGVLSVVPPPWTRRTNLPYAYLATCKATQSNAINVFITHRHSQHDSHPAMY